MISIGAVAMPLGKLVVDDPAVVRRGIGRDGGADQQAGVLEVSARRAKVKALEIPDERGFV